MVSTSVIVAPNSDRRHAMNEQVGESPTTRTEEVVSIWTVKEKLKNQQLVSYN